MKSIIIAIVTAIVAFAISYLMGAFVEVSFDITKWQFESRATVGGFCGFISFVLGVIAGLAYENSKSIRL